MQNDFVQRFLSSDRTEKVSPLVIVFAFLQILFSIIIITIFFNLLNRDDYISYENLENLPEAHIENLPEGASWLSESNKDEIEKALYQKIVQSSTNLDKVKTTAEVRENTFKTHYSNDTESSFLSMVVDLPNLEQSYQIIYEYPKVLFDPDSLALVLCLDEYNEKKYPSHECSSKYDDKDRNLYASAYIEQSTFNDFNVVSYDDDKALRINPNKADFTESEEKGYIDEVKEKLETFGVSPNRFRIEVTHPSDLDYTLTD
ncbi:hypothetical protein J6S37_03215 [Candidatus Saccharibacteria bacterium]|nr:hypothetical protein [Candidatus Saccharibacteria bacterium]